MLWNRVLDVCPDTLATELVTMPDATRTMMIMNAFNCNYVNDWHEIYESLLEFVTIMFSRYQDCLT